MSSFLMKKFEELVNSGEVKDEDIIAFKEEFDESYKIEQDEESDKEEEGTEAEDENSEEQEQEEEQKEEPKMKKKKMYNDDESKGIKAEIIEYKLINFANKNSIDIDLVDFLSIDEKSNLEDLKEKLFALDKKINNKTSVKKAKKLIIGGESKKKFEKKKTEDDFIDFGKRIASKYK